MIEDIDFEAMWKALEKISEDKPWQLGYVRLINDHKIGKRTVLRLAEVRRFAQSYGSWDPRNA